MKIAILSTEEQWEMLQIKDEAEKRGHFVSFIDANDFSGNEIFETDYDLVLLRSLRGTRKKTDPVIKYWYRKGTKIIDEHKAIEEKTVNKITNYRLMAEAGLNVPKTFRLDNVSDEKVMQEFNGRIVVKPRGGKRGENITFLLPNELHDFRKTIERPQRFIVQEFFEFEKEYRVLVLGSGVLGAFSKKTDGLIKNISMGAVPVREELTDLLKETALTAAKATKREFVGVDIGLAKDSRLIVLEVNRSPQFRSFQKTHPEINVAREIVRYMERKIIP